MNENENKPLPDEESVKRDEENEAQTTTSDGSVQSDEELTVAESETGDTAEQSEAMGKEMKSEPTVVYRWDYAAQTAEDAQAMTRNRRNGVLTFAIVMSVCFLVTLSVLVASLLSGGLSDIWQDDDGLYGDGTLHLGGEQGDVLSLQEISSRGNEVVVAVSIQTALGTGSGTGIIMTEDGYIATNHHVIEDANEITVQLYDGTKCAAKLVGSSEIDDLAVLKIDKKGLPVAVFGDSSQVMIGDRAVVIGHPAGLEFGWTSTYGFVSAINRDVKIRDYSGTLVKKMTLIQTDANVNRGNSGGPMFNDRGEVIGIITLKLAGNYEGMGFAIPSNGAVPLLEALMQTGTTDGVQSEVSAQRPFIGITGVSVVENEYYVLGTNSITRLTEQEAAETEGSFQATATGVLVTSVSAWSDAYNKVQQDDIITELDGVPLKNMNAMLEYLYDCHVGDTVEITYIRNGKTETALVILKAAE